MNLATPTDLGYRFDTRELLQLSSDNNVPATSLNNTIILAALSDASGVVLSALRTAYRYTETDLTTLDAESASLLKRLTCDLAFVYMAQRRGYSYKEKFPLIEDSYEILQKLRNGERVLNVAGVEEAGNTFSQSVTVVDQRLAGLVSTAWRYFPLHY